MIRSSDRKPKAVPLIENRIQKENSGKFIFLKVWMGRFNQNRDYKGLGDSEIPGGYRDSEGSRGLQMVQNLEKKIQIVCKNMTKMNTAKTATGPNRG